MGTDHGNKERLGFGDASVDRVLCFIPNKYGVRIKRSLEPIKANGIAQRGGILSNPSSASTEKCPTDKRLVKTFFILPETGRTALISFFLVCCSLFLQAHL